MQRLPEIVVLGLALFAGCGDDSAAAPDDAGAEFEAAGETTGETDAGADLPAEVETEADVPGDTPAETPAEAGDGGPCVDECPVATGIPWGCRRRFLYGVNYAWRHFVGDFGGIPAWGQTGVAGDRANYRADLQRMHDHGASVIRWWMFPDFRGAGILFDGDENPTGLGPTTLDDLAAALELAAETDLYLMLCLFSFDNFRPSREEYGVAIPGIAPLVRDEARRRRLLEQVVRPLARAAQADPHHDRLIAWDVINEPEWAMTGPSPYGDEDYDPNGELEAVTHAQMETFVAETIAVLRAESEALITVGGTAWKWAHAWTRVDLDFYQIHMYDWINRWWPYSNPPATYGLTDKPVVMGEFPMGDLTAGVTYDMVVDSWWSNGYAGALSWMYDGADEGSLDLVAGFAARHPCETRY
ncbi:MAG: hypothetical protein GYA57_18675 [Myxococcales bacterium]|nr:hypothetical protein [Myxococcales bacterium]